MKILSIEKGMNLSGYVYCFKSLACLVSPSCTVSHIANENEKKLVSLNAAKKLKRERVGLFQLRNFRIMNLQQ